MSLYSEEQLDEITSRFVARKTREVFGKKGSRKMKLHIDRSLDSALVSFQ